MTTRLEDQLTTAMQEHTAGTRLSRDVLAAARFRHRRRTAVHRAVSVTGTAGVAGAVALAVWGGPPVGEPSTPPAASAGAPAGSEPVALNAEQVAARVTARLADSRSTVQHVRVQTSMDGRTSRMEVWSDERSDAYRVSGSKVPGAPRVDSGLVRQGGRSVYTAVHHGPRTWYRQSFPAGYVVSEPGKAGDLTPEGIRRAMTEGDHHFTIVGKEKLDGRSTVHLRITGQADGGVDDMWVDARTYQLLRRVVVRKDPGHSTFRAQEDYEWLPRTNQALSQVRVTAPAGYKKVAPPPPLPPGQTQG